ncbi:MAG: DsbE family thiol:disulfide interchange protein [Silicimonas sp.]|nr:DsbE family thiol:disulfide interchange protein [Silicimonas sp.]
MARISPLALAPPVIFAALAGLFLSGMFREDPDALPSQQEGDPAPAITALPVGDLPVFDGADLAAPGAKVVNFWASWCAPCRLEHPYIEKIGDLVPVYGVNRDHTDAQAKGFLDDLGNPYSAVVADPQNRQSIEWGVYALPETFVVDGQGRVVLHIRGPINEPIFEKRIKPAIEAASTE